MASILLLVFFLLLHTPLLQSTEEEIRYTKECPHFSCGPLSFGFPFARKSHPECGVFIVECPDSKDLEPRIQLGDGGRFYPILDVSQNNTLRIFNQELMKFLDPELAYRCESFSNLTFPSSSFFSFEIVSNQTFFFKCDRTLNVQPPPDFKTIPCDHSVIYYNLSNKSFPDAFSGCSIIQLPENSTPENSSGALRPLPNRDDPFPLVSPEFNLEVHVSSECYDCFYKGGKCNASANGKFYCDDGTEGNNRLTVMQLALSALLLGVGVLMVAICFIRRQFISNSIIYFWKRKDLTHQTMQAFLRDHGTLVIKRYSYSDIKKITNSFNEKLGQGGYGGVYKGKLQDGFLVAVKVLKESKGNGEEFINEVASISRTSHVNIVSLIGFCFEGSKRALIYKFMPNGSLEKFIYKVNPSKNIYMLEWETIYKIALGIARGLEYLHRGCNTQILHFDIKPHNILLDENFCPKISDFGLAKICPREQSILSMLGARGTIGYIAPEVFCRSFGKVSHKSDVYSYGMMVFEMIEGRRNIEVDVDHTSEIYFPHWIYKQLEQDKNLGLQNLLNEKDHESAKKMIIVSLWCIQTDPSNRPSMSRVVNMLEGLEQLEVPPEPFLSLPSRSSESSSTIMGSLQYNFVTT